MARQLFHLSDGHFDDTGLTVTTLHLACEMACHNILVARYEADDASVGIRNDIWFWGDAEPGSYLEAEAVISHIDRKRIVFNVFARSGVVEIARGQHERMLVSRTAFMGSLASL
ncbi:MAG: thioesterase, FlK family [Alphaproteobacteria bacterium]